MPVFGAVLRNYVGKAVRKLRVTVRRKGAPAPWPILGMGEGRTAPSKGMLKSIKTGLQLALVLYAAKSGPCGQQHSQRSLLP